MKKTVVIAAIFAAALGGAAMAQDKGAGPPMTKVVNETADEETKLIDQETGLSSFARADKEAASMQGFKGRNARGANRPGSCAAGQKKKGSGSRLHC